MNTIKIGNQEWMTENLNITDVGLGRDHWKNPKNGEVYYSWEAAMRIAKRVGGFHLPTAEEWNKLAEDCGGVCINTYEKNPGYKKYNNIIKLKDKLGIKFAGNYSPHSKNFFGVGHYAYFWSSSRKSGERSCGRGFDGGRSMGAGYTDRKFGLSVRLIKD